ncbi:MAG: helicase-associated domain-containing protein [Trueperaceae bacterium]|nr:helicase-associated domain-containing protein [Trueperaceae bacterium]
MSDGDQRLLFAIERRMDDDDDADAPLPVAADRDPSARASTRMRPAAGGIDLTRALPQLQATDLQRIARRFAPGIRLPVKKADLARTIADTLGSPPRIDAVVARLAPVELELLAELARRGGGAAAWELATHVALRGHAPPTLERRPHEFYRWLGSSGASALLKPMVEEGLLVRAGGPAWPPGAGPYDDAWVGADPRLLARVPLRRPADPVPLDLPAAAPPPAGAPHPMAVVLEVIDAALLVLDLGGVPLTRAETIARPFVRRLERERPLRAGRMETLVHTLFALGLLRPPSEAGATGRAHPWLVDREDLATFLRLPPYLAYAAIVDASCRVGDGRVDVGWGEGAYGDARAGALRRAVFDALPALPAHPVALEEAATALWRGPLVNVFGWPERAGVPSQYGRRQPWEIASVLAGTCVRLALLATSEAPRALGMPPDDVPPPQSIALALGARWYAAARARLLGHAGPEDDGLALVPHATRGASGADGAATDDAAATAPAAGHDAAPGHAWPLVVQPNFEVLAYLDRLDTEAVAALTCATAVRIDPNTAAFELDRRSVSRALGLGRDVDGLIADLRAHAGAVPANVERAMRDWAERRDRLRATLDARLVEYADEAARDAALAQLPRARPVGERFALIPPRAKAPAGERHRYRDTPERGITVDAAGNVRITGALDLAGRVVVHALTRAGPRGRLAFDPDAVRARPLPGGWRDVLKARLAKAMPAHVDALLLAWSGDAPPPALQGAVLFRHPRASAWAQHPRLAPYLGAALNDATYLVAGEAIAPLAAALRELGVEVDGTGAAPVVGGVVAVAGAEARAAADAAPVDRLVTGLSTRRVRERLEEAIAAHQLVELRYAPERERYGRYGRVHRSRGKVRTARFEPLLVRHRGSLPYLHARPVDAEGDDDEELIRIGYVEAIAVIG